MQDYKDIAKELKKYASTLSTLFVDDEKSIRESFSQTLKIFFQQVTVCSSAQEVLNLCENNSYDIIVSDINMPQMDGLKMANILKDKDPNQVIVIMSAHSDKNHLLDAFKTNVDGYITKPFDFVEDSKTLVHICRKIMEQKEAQSTKEQLSQTNEFYKQTLYDYQTAIDKSAIVSKTDATGRITYVSDSFCEISGYSRKELLGSSHNIIRHESVSRDAYKELWDTIQSKNTWHGIVKNKTKNGKTYFLRANIFPMLNVDGEITEYISIQNDITEEMNNHERLEGNLESLKQRTEDKEYLLRQYEKIINLDSAFFRIDKNFHFLHANDVFCDLFDCHEVNSEKLSITNFLESSFIVNSFEPTLEIIKQQGTWSGVVPFRKKDETILHMKTSINTIYDRNKNFVEFMVVLHDITDLITAQKEIIDTQKDVVLTMGSIGETRCKETGNHVKRVAEYSKLFALIHGLGEEQAELLKMASPMHDIGKVGIPDEILNKPGKLSMDEWKIMQTHADLGYSMLKGSKREILQTAATIAYTHHEKWDGTGYPESLQGEEIHIFGRITALADVFDALGSDRCYKDAWDDEKVFTLIQEEKGKHFDPKLVDIFFNNLDHFLEIRSKFQD